jgi:hypothetical protein
MTPAGYTEDALVERPAIALLAALGWETINAYQEFDRGASTLGRETKAEVILTARLRPALQRLNPTAPPEAINQAIQELTRDRSRMSMVAANREIYHLLKNGVRVPMPDPGGDGATGAGLYRLAAGFGLSVLAQALVLSVLPEAGRLLDPSAARIGWPSAHASTLPLALTVIARKPGGAVKRNHSAGRAPA